MNYVDHCVEQNVPVPSVPLVFSKFGSCVCGPGDPIPRYGPSPGSAVRHGGTTAGLDAEPVVTSKLDYVSVARRRDGRAAPRSRTAACSVCRKASRSRLRWPTSRWASSPQ